MDEILDDMIVPTDWTAENSIIKVIGVGGGGCNAVNYMYNQKVQGCCFIVCNTDAQALGRCDVPIKIQLGTGLGAGCDPTKGRNAAIESEEKIARILDSNTKITEFSTLNDALRRSVERNERQYEQQKLFIANASHEMQTPLAVCTNRLEMLLDEDNLTETQMADIIKTLRTLKSLSATNRSLLLLCKIDNGQFVNRVTVDLETTTMKILPDLAAVYANRRIQVKTAFTGAAEVDMDEQLAGILIGNLLKNAFIHNVDGGEISVTSDGKTYTVANTGSLRPLDDSKIFERFYHSAGKKSSTGLGLSLVKAISNLYGLDIKYAFTGGMHTFTLSIGKA